jgi:NAD(P)H-dependent FMN reductase
MFLVLSTSLHPDSRSRILATACRDRLTQVGRDNSLFDLAVTPLPQCDGHSAYSHPHVAELNQLIRDARAIIIASPVYNYDVTAAAKNAVELTGRAWTGKVVSMMLAAGGQGSYMSGMGLANSLMLDFRCIIVPRFVYATGDAFEGSQLTDEAIQTRVEQLVHETMRLADAVASF